MNCVSVVAIVLSWMLTITAVVVIPIYSFSITTAPRSLTFWLFIVNGSESVNSCILSVEDNLFNYLIL